MTAGQPCLSASTSHTYTAYKTRSYFPYFPQWPQVHQNVGKSKTHWTAGSCRAHERFMASGSTRKSTQPSARSLQGIKPPSKHWQQLTPSVLTYRLGVKSSNDLGAGHGLQSVLQSLKVHTLLGVIGRIHQHSQAALHACQLGRNHRHILPPGKATRLLNTTWESTNACLIMTFYK